MLLEKRILKHQQGKSYEKNKLKLGAASTQNSRIKIFTPKKIYVQEQCHD